MVTGVETAGLVLGAFPLLLQGFEVYLDGSKKVADLWHWRNQLYTIIEELNFEYHMFELTCKRIFEELGDTELMDGTVKIWETSDFEARIIDHMGKPVAMSFLGQVKRFVEFLDIARNELGLDHITLKDLEEPEDTAKRQALDKAKVKIIQSILSNRDILENVKEVNNRLERFERVTSRCRQAGVVPTEKASTEKPKTISGCEMKSKPTNNPEPESARIADAFSNLKTDGLVTADTEKPKTISGCEMKSKPTNNPKPESTRISDAFGNFETAGFVLGTFPLLLQGVGIYLEGSNKVAGLWNWRRQLSTIIREFTVEHSLFTMTCERIFEELGDTESMGGISQLMDGRPEIWRTSDFKARLTEQMGPEIAVVFLREVELLYDLLEDVRNQLGLDGIMPEDLERLKGSEKHPILKKAKLKVIKSILSNSDLLENIKKSTNTLKETAAAVKLYKRLRDYALNLYTVLEETFAPCKCTILSHTGHLQLSRVATDNPEPKFTVLFSYNTETMGWCELEFEPIDNPEPKSAIIDNLCRAIQGASRNYNAGKVYELGILDSPKSKCKHRVRFLGFRFSPIYLSDVVSLGTLLEYGMFGEQKDRLEMSVILATAAMQLYGTVWLKDCWGKDDIFFLQTSRTIVGNDQKPIKIRNPVLGKPLVCRLFESPFSNRRSSPVPTRTSPKHDGFLRSLGIILVELLYGKPITQICPNEPGVEDISKITVSFADDLVDRITSDAGQLYACAVRNCIRGIDHDVRSLDNDEFRGKVDTAVVMNLKRHYDAFTEGGGIDEITQSKYLSS